MTSKDIYLSFSLAPIIGPKRLRDLLKVTKTTDKAWSATALDFKKIGLSGESFGKFAKFRGEFDVKTYLIKLKQKGVEIVTQEDTDYPDLLKKIDSPPIVLFTKGNKKLLNEKSIAVVGSRKTTSYGREVTQMLVSDLVRANIVITSGLALGVDSVAHRSALENRGATIAVLGSGVDCCTPGENQGLYNEILKNNGLIISEYPLGAIPTKGSFPARNRIIAGISQAILVTEARENSGALITANEAVKQGKKIFAVPGSIVSVQSKGTIELLKGDAILVSTASDVLDELNLKSVGLSTKSSFGNLNLSKEEKKIVEALESENLSVDEVVRQVKIPIKKLILILSELEMRGLIVSSGGKFGLKM